MRIMLFAFLFVLGLQAMAQSQPLEIYLPAPNLKGTMSVEEALNKRRSVRHYDTSPLTLQELSQMLWAAFGLTKEMDMRPEQLRGGFRTAPSAGALYPLYLYAVISKVTGVEPGIYKYTALGHKLTLVRKSDFARKLCDACNGQIMVENAPLNLVFSYVEERTTKKYGERGKERYICMDAGHAGQNIYLQATALGLGTCAIGYFFDADIKEMLMLPEEEDPLYIFSVGRLRK